jgi:hypothetical protein
VIGIPLVLSAIKQKALANTVKGAMIAVPVRPRLSARIVTVIALLLFK